MGRSKYTSEKGSSTEQEEFQQNRNSHTEVKIPRSDHFLKRKNSSTSDAEQHLSYKLLLIKKLNPEKLDTQLENLLGKDFTGNAVILDNKNNIYYVKNGVLEYKEKTGIGQKSDIPLTVKIVKRHPIKYCRSSLFSSDLEDVSHFPDAERIINEAVLARKELPKSMTLIVAVEKRLERIKYSFKTKLYESIIKVENEKGLEIERHPFADLQNYERKAIFEILYKEKVEEVISSDKEFGVVIAEEYKLTNSPLSKAPIWFYVDGNGANPHAIYHAIQKRINKQFISLFLDIVPVDELKNNPKDKDYSTIMDYFNHKSLKFSQVFLRYLELYYKAEIRNYIQDNNLAPSIALYRGLKQLPALFNEKFLTEIGLMIYAAAKKVTNSSTKLNPKILSNIKLIQEEIDAHNKASSILNTLIKESKDFQTKFNILKKAISAKNFITPEIKSNIYDHLKPQAIIIELILEMGKRENYQHLKNKSQAQKDECTYRVYLLFSQIKQIGPWIVEENMRANKEEFLTTIEEKLEKLLYQKNQLTHDFHQHMNSYVVNNQVTPQAKPKPVTTKTTSISNLTVPAAIPVQRQLTLPEKKSSPSVKPKLITAPPPSLTFVEKMVKIFWGWIKHFTSSEQRVEQSPQIQARIHGTQAVHYVIIKKTQPLVAHKDPKPKSISSYDKDCSHILSMSSASHSRFFKDERRAIIPHGKNLEHSSPKSTNAIGLAS